MITLNSNRGFVKVERWEEIEELPGFTRNLNPDEHDLQEVIGRYIFKEYIRCGLSSCHTPHGKGYIVSTKSGLVTNIGHHCGKTHFKIEFDEMSKSFERDVALHNYRETIGSVLIILDHKKDELRNLRQGENGADVLYKKGQALLRKSSGCPEQAVGALSKMVRNRNSDLIQSRMATKTEVEDLEDIQGIDLPRPYYIDEKVGEIQGLPFLYKENDLRDIIVLDLEEGFNTLNEINVENEEFKTLKHWSAWCSAVDRKIDSVRSIIEVAKSFLDRDNILKLKKIISNPEQRETFSKFVARNM